MCCFKRYGAPEKACRITMMSGFIACMFLAVSIRVSPFVAELVEAAMLKVSALIRFAATSKDNRVRVDGSRKILIIVLPRSVGTFLIVLLEISLNDRAVAIICWMSLTDNCSMPSICLCVNMYSVFNLFTCANGQITSE